MALAKTLYSPGGTLRNSNPWRTSSVTASARPSLVMSVRRADSPSSVGGGRRPAWAGRAAS
jgi:hypothetical protein